MAAARDVGIAYALTGLLRAAPFHARAKRLYLPADRVGAAGLETHRTLFELKPSPALAQIVGEVAVVARQHLAAARRIRREIPRRAVPALLPAIVAGRWLDQLDRARHDIFDPSVARRDPMTSWRIAAAAALGRY